MGGIKLLRLYCILYFSIFKLIAAYLRPALRLHKLKCKRYDPFPITSTRDLPLPPVFHGGHYPFPIKLPACLGNILLCKVLEGSCLLTFSLVISSYTLFPIGITHQRTAALREHLKDHACFFVRVSIFSYTSPPQNEFTKEQISNLTLASGGL